MAPMVSTICHSVPPCLLYLLVMDVTTLQKCHNVSIICAMQVRTWQLGMGAAGQMQHQPLHQQWGCGMQRSLNTTIMILYFLVPQVISHSLSGRRPPRLALEPHWPPVETGLLWLNLIRQAMCKGSLLPMFCRPDAVKFCLWPDTCDANPLYMCCNKQLAKYRT